MKIAYFGYNSFCSCLDLLQQSGHEIMCIYTGELGFFTDRVISFAKQYHIPLSFDKPNKVQMDKLKGAGVELFLAAEYPWKIPVPDDLPYAINIHPTMLPEGRGATPLPWLLLIHPEHAGITFHKLSNHFDQGEILLQKKIHLDDYESYDTLSAKLYIQIPVLLDKLISNIEHYYQHAIKQGAGSNWGPLSRAEQTVDWYSPTNKILKQMRAFGSLGVYAQLPEQQYLITAAEGVEVEHNYSPGKVILFDQTRLVIASQDGMISILRSSLLSIK